MKKAHAQIRRSQTVSTWGPGALLDMPNYSVIMGGLDTWPALSKLEEIHEPRLTRKLQMMTGLSFPRLYAPPSQSNHPQEAPIGIGAWRFPEWFVVQEKDLNTAQLRSRRLVHRNSLQNNKYDGLQVVPTRFVRACPKGHIDDLDWYCFVHRGNSQCRRPLWLDEKGTSGDLGDLSVRCECGQKRSLYDATLIETNPLGTCFGKRPWLGRDSQEGCTLPSRLLIRTAANAYFSQVLSVLSIPERNSEVDVIVNALWDDFSTVEDISEIKIFRRKPKNADQLAPFSDSEIMEAIQRLKQGGNQVERPVKLVELDALVNAPEGYGEDVPIDPNFHARRLPEHIWRKSGLSKDIEAVIQLHRLREVLALTGFTRFEAEVPDINGEFETDVERAELALDPSWFPAIENKGEGIFIQLKTTSVHEWLGQPSVKKRLEHLILGHNQWLVGRKSQRSFPGGAYILLHTLSHLLLQSLSLYCGYPSSSIRERIYADSEAQRYGILLYTGSPDAEGTLGGLVQQARHLESHLRYALRSGALCSNDPICAQHNPGESMERRWLQGAACHGCTLIAETSCEMRNDYLDRALVIPTLAHSDAAFFGNFG